MHEAEIGNIAQGEAECYISIKAECQMLYFFILCIAHGRAMI